MAGIGAGIVSVRIARRPSSRLLDPCGLDRLEDLLARSLRVVVESRQGTDPVVEVGEAHGPGIDVRMFLGERDGDLPRIRPFHAVLPETAHRLSTASRAQLPDSLRVVEGSRDLTCFLLRS